MAARMAPPLSPLVAAILAVLKAAYEQGHAINRTKLTKLLYFADLRAVEAGGTPFTGATWRWRLYGPHDVALLNAEDQAVQTLQMVDRNGNDEYRLSLALDIADPMPAEQMHYIREVVADLGHLRASDLRKLSYDTPPMVSAAGAGDREIILDLGHTRRRRQREARIEAARRARSARERQVRDPGAASEILVEFDAAADSILRANTEGLGD